jgi:Rieske Fe-S protein
MAKGTDSRKISRRAFFPQLSTAIGLFFAGLAVPFLRPVSRVKKISLKTIENMPSGLNLYEELIIVKKNNHLSLYSRKCTHLGCRLQKGENAPLHCPCHGSEFSETGEVLHGPAEEPLKKIDFREKNGELVWRS